MQSTKNSFNSIAKAEKENRLSVLKKYISEEDTFFAGVRIDKLITNREVIPEIDSHKKK
jgi:hypothetical protein